MDRRAWHGVTRVEHHLATKPPPPDTLKGFPGGSAIKNLPANARDAGDTKDTGSVLGSGRCPGGGNGHPLQYSCLKNPMDRGTWQATVQRVTQSCTQLKKLRTQAQNCVIIFIQLIFTEYLPCALSGGLNCIRNNVDLDS